MARSDFPAAVGLDTSVVVRLLIGEPAPQAERALAVLQQFAAQGGRALVSDMVVVEAYSALYAHYAVPKKKARAALLRLLESSLVDGEPDGCAASVLAAMERSGQKPGFADRLIHAQYRKAGGHLLTFEKAAAKLGDVLVLEGAT